MESKHKILLIIGLIALVWFLIINYSSRLTNLNPILLFFLFNGIVFLIPSIIIGKLLDPSSWVSSKTFGLFIIFTALNLLSPALIVEKTGALSCDTIFCQTSTDAMVRSFWMMFHFDGFLLYLLTYPISFFLLFTIGLYLLNGNVKEAFSND